MVASAPLAGRGLRALSLMKLLDTGLIFSELQVL